VAEITKCSSRKGSKRRNIQEGGRINKVKTLNRERRI
jgi:hypothetical protein